MHRKIQTNRSPLEEGRWLSIDWSGGLIPCIVQEAETRRVLMLGYANQQSLEQSLSTGRATFFSRSRQKLWVKGETSGNYLRIVDIYIDCDQDCLLYSVELEGDGACHTKGRSGRPRKSCFYRRILGAKGELEFL